MFCDVCASASVGPRWWHRRRLRNKYGFGFAINTASASQRYRLRHITKSCTTLPGGLTGPPTRGRSRAYLFQGARKVGPPIPPPLPPLFCASASVCGCPLSPVRQYIISIIFKLGGTRGRGRSGLSGIAEPGPWDLRAGRSGRSVVPFFYPILFHRQYNLDPHLTVLCRVGVVSSSTHGKTHTARHTRQNHTARQNTHGTIFPISVAISAQAKLPQSIRGFKVIISRTRNRELAFSRHANLPRTHIMIRTRMIIWISCFFIARDLHEKPYDRRAAEAVGAAAA